MGLPLRLEKDLGAGSIIVCEDVCWALELRSYVTRHSFRGLMLRPFGTIRGAYWGGGFFVSSAGFSALGTIAASGLLGRPSLVHEEMNQSHV